MKKNPIPLPNRIEAAVAASQGRMMIRRAAFCLACLMGLVVLYYCLVPALTQNGTADALYVFFDNGLSQYEGRTNADGSTTVVSAQVYENAEDADPTELMMHRLSDVIAENGTLWSSVKAQLGASVKGDGGSITIDNVNPANVFVSAEPVPVGQLITFSGWDSGTVHDTVTNYRINSASREWGYDYRDFQWTSPLMPLNPSSGVCFYASPQLMINRYAAEAALTEGGEKALVQMIWEHGDKKGDAYSKPEVPGAWVNPGTADGRTFYDAVLTMEGCFGDVNAVNRLGDTSQSSTNTLEGSVVLGGNGDNGLSTANQQYHASATFFDYFSDWELAGKPLVSHKTAYTYANADGNDIKPIWAMHVDYTAIAPITEKFAAGSVEETGFVNIGSSAAYIRATSDKLSGHPQDGTNILQMEEDSIVEYALPDNATGGYVSASMWVMNGTGSPQSVTLTLHYELNGEAHDFLMNQYESPSWGVTWQEFKSGSFYLPEGAENASLRYSTTGLFRLDDFTLKYEGDGVPEIVYETETASSSQIFNADDMGGFTPYGTSNVYVRTGKLNSRTDDGSWYLFIQGRGTAEYQMPYATGKDISVSAWVKKASDNVGTFTATIHYKLNGVEYSQVLNELSILGWEADNGAWTQVTCDTFSLPDGATDISIRYGAPNNFQIDDFTISYEKYKTADTVITNADFAAGTPADYGFDTVDVEGDNGGSLSVNSDGRLYSFYHQPAVYTLTADQLKAGNYHYSIDVLSTQWGLDALSVFLSTDNGNTGTLLQTVQIGADSADGTVHEISGDFTVPIGSSGVKLYFQTFNAWWTNWTDGTHRTDSAFYDNFVLQYEKSSYTEIPTAGAVNSSVTTSYTRDDSYAKDYADYMAVTLSDTNCVIGGNGAELFVCAAANEKGVVPLQGINTYSNKETYLLEGTAYSTDKVKIIARHYKSQTAKDVLVGEEVLGEFEPGPMHISLNFAPPIGAGSTVIVLETENGGRVLLDDLTIGMDLIDIKASFSEGTNTIAYSYQGQLFNDAISKYYASLGLDGTSIVPLYFGSNSWMTGNGRYFDADRNDQLLFTPDQINAALNALDGAVYTITHSDVSGLDIVDDKGASPGVGAYIMPYTRQYWQTLYGFASADDNTPHGFSNSRAVEGLMVYDPSFDILQLDGTTVESPYFSEKFLMGENEAHAAYGAVYPDVDFSFAYNEDTGYYEFDSTRAWYATRLTQNAAGGYYMDYYNYDQIVTHLAEANADGNQVLYADSSLMGVKKADTSYKDGNGSSQTVYQFYPFNSPETNDRFATENLMFGMKLDIPFNMYASADKRNNSMFKFSGDDDVWVYVDGQPVLDIGGTHTAVGGFIDLKNGYGVVGSSYADYTGYAKEIAGLGGTEFVTGQDGGVTNVEKAAFALLASQDEISPSAGWQKTEKVNFFDDTFKAASNRYVQNGTNVMQYQYAIRAVEGTNEQVIDVKFRNAMNASKDPADIKVLTDDDQLTSIVTAEQAADPNVNPYGMAEGDKCYVVTQADVETAYRLWKNKASNYTVTASHIADALDDGIIHPVGTVLPRDFVIYGDTGLTNHLGYPTINGNVTFDLTQFTLEETDQNVDLTEHELTIYYMERGLNSSNFKLAFNFIPNAQREVEKVWADGNANHVNDDDYVDVELWRTEPQNGNTSFAFPENYALVRSLAHGSLTDAGSALSKFIEDNDEVTVQYNMNDSGTDSAATLTLNSVVLSLEAYRQLNASNLGLTVYLNDVPVSLNSPEADAADDDDGDGNTLDPGEFYDPSADDAGFAVVRAAVDTYTDGSESRYTAIKLHDNDEADPNMDVPTVMKIVFKAKANGVSVNAAYNTWGFRSSNVWLVESYGYDRTNDTAIAVSDQSVLSDLTQDYLAVICGEASVTLQASDMVIGITNAAREAEDGETKTGFYANNYFAYAVASDMSMDMQYVYDDGARNIDVWTGTWNGAFTAPVYTQVLNNKQVAQGVTETIPLKSADQTESKVYIVRTSCDKAHNNIGSGISYASAVEAVIYSDPVMIGKTEKLNNAASWKKLWDNIVESVTLDGETYNYHYFIREVGAHSTYGSQLSDYKTLYYDIDGNQILPTIIKGDNPETKDVVETDFGLTLYSIDTKGTAGTKGYVKIVNNPITSAAVSKTWAVKEESDKINIVVTLYGEDATNPGVITEVTKVLLSSENDYAALIEALPLFNPETSGAMTYYAAEEISAKYRASYSTQAVTKTCNGIQMQVYPFRTPEIGETSVMSLSVINQVEGFVLEINKVDEDGTTPLQGAEFVLYEWDETLQDWVVLTDQSAESDSQLNLSGASGSALSHASIVNGWQMLSQAGSTITDDVYYSFDLYDSAADANPYADQFEFTGSISTGNNDGTMTYNNKSYTKFLKFGSNPDISFTLGSSAKLVLLCKYREGDGYGSPANLKINGTQYSVTSRESDNTLEVELEAGTYTIERTSSQIYLYYIGIEFPDETTTEAPEDPTESTTTTKYNKNDAESFMNALKEEDSWFSSPEGIQLADDLVDLQLADASWGWGRVYAKDYGIGGWQKDPDYYTKDGVECTTHWYHATIDNNVTTAHIRYLARAYRVTGNEQYKQSVIKGIECLIGAQYTTGGWPQVFKLDTCGHDAYHHLTTFNDAAMTKVLEMLMEIRDQSGDFSGIVDDTLAGSAGDAVVDGIRCILDTQITLNGQLTGWCQQYDGTTPAAARAHELPSISGGESSGIVKFLQSVLSDTEIYANHTKFTKTDLITAINAAVQWYKDVAIQGYVLEGNRIPVAATNNDYIWARFYAIEPMTDYEGNTIVVNQPFFVERNDNNEIKIHANFSDMPSDQQTSYQWYGTWGRNFLNMEPITTDTTLPVSDAADLLIYDTARYSLWQSGTNLQLGSTVYGDRTFTYTSLPDVLHGAAYVMTACDSKNFTGDLAQLTAESDQIVYVAMDTRVSTAPVWLSDWTLQADMTAEASDGNQTVTYRLYSRAVEAGETITLGTNGQASGCVGYTVMTVDDESSDDVVIDVPDDAMIFITDENGRALIGGLQPGKYRLVEAKAPIGYVPCKKSIEFEVLSDEDGGIRTDTVSYVPNSFVNIKWSDTSDLTLTATIKNKFVSIEIPGTGGRGTIAIFAGSAVLIVTAGVLMVRRRKQK